MCSCVVRRPNTPVLSTGYFLSVWEKQEDNSWKVILDAGTNTPPPKGPLHNFTFPAGADQEKKLCVKNTQRSVADIEDAMLASWKNQRNPKAYESFLHDDARIIMQGQLPEKEKGTLTSWLSGNGNSFEWKLSGSTTAPSGDMAFTYGYALLDGKIKGTYVRIWKLENGDTWKILIDLLSLD